MKIGRNRICPCGSGKKYKHCCAQPLQEQVDVQNIAGIAFDPEEKQVLFVTKDILINTLRRDGPKAAESFDRLHDVDLREMSELLGRTCFLLTHGLKEVNRKNDELRIVRAHLCFNAINTFIGATSLLREGFYLQASILVRTILEALATVIHLAMTPSDLSRFKRNELELKAIIPSAKKIVPPFGHMYGMFSEMFVHVG